jgi:NAD(P)-dependent dehydrogenase (short-subunit alcohol dehydrogenase family)
LTQTGTGALNGRVVVVTGAARGYGRALVEGLLAAGAQVVALDLAWDDETSDGTQARPDFLPLAADISDDDALDRAFEATIKVFGTVDALVNNAALLQRLVFPEPYAPVLESDLSIWERMFAVNFFGPVKVTRRFIRPMIEKRRGSVVIISSGSALRGRAGDQPYGATKAALTNLASSLAAEVREHNVAVNAIIPATAVTTGYERQRVPRVPPQPGVTPAAGNSTPWKPEALVPLVCHLVQQDATMQTGELIKVVDWNIANGFGGDEVWAAEPD